jgi:lincosamide nucleotidyltransferase A/C/D/E
MRSDEVLHVLDRLAAEGIVAWVDGRWGVDALLEQHTRDHSDVDLVTDAAAMPRFNAGPARRKI